MDTMIKIVSQRKGRILALITAVLMIACSAVTFCKYVGEQDLSFNFSINATQLTATFNGNTGTVSGDSSKTVLYQKAYGALPTATKAGFTFDGWYTAASGGNLLTAASIVTNGADHTLYAHWTMLPTLKALDPTFYSSHGVDTTSITDTGNGVVQALASDMDTNGRVDPQMIYTLGAGISAKAVDYVYVKLYSPHVAIGNRFEMFYTKTNYSTDASGVLSSVYTGITQGTAGSTSYTSNNSLGDGWYEFIFPTSGFPNWNGTINMLRFDPFDSNPENSTAAECYTVANDGTDTFKISEIRLLSSKVSTTTNLSSANLPYTAPAPVNSTTRADPRVNLTGLSLSAAGTSGIFVRGTAASVPVGTMLQVYYNNGSMSENTSFGQVYGRPTNIPVQNGTATDTGTGAQEFILYYDTSDVNPGLRSAVSGGTVGNKTNNWTGTISALRVDPFDTLHNAFDATNGPNTSTAVVINSVGYVN